MQWILGAVVLVSVTRLFAQMTCKTHVLLRDPILSVVTSPSMAVALLAVYLYNKQ